MNDSLGDRMKMYEDNTRYYLTKRVPVIVRLDGKGFHNLTKKYFNKGFDVNFLNIMQLTATYIANNVQGCSLAYCQSDEISLLLTDYKTIQTQGFFDYNINKIVSITASMASAWFTANLSLQLNNRSPLVLFDSRAFNLSQDEVCNYFIWRQQDATRNAIQMAGHENFSHKELQNKSCNDIQEMLFTNKQINFNDYPTIRKRGFCIVNGQLDDNIPIFTQDRKYIEQHVYIRED